jgi:hypothetical protein
VECPNFRLSLFSHRQDALEINETKVEIFPHCLEFIPHHLKIILHR